MPRYEATVEIEALSETEANTKLSSVEGATLVWIVEIGGATDVIEDDDDED